MKVNHLSFSYNHQSYMKDINIQFKDQKITTIIGPNGSGKSTLLMLLSRIYKIQQGSIELDNKNIWDYKIKEFARKVAVVHQKNQVYGDLNVRTIIGYGRLPYLNYHQSLSKEDKQIIDWAIEVTNLKEHQNKMLNSLSGGQQQRVWIALALAQKTPILLLDEPTTYLDIKAQIETLNLLRKINVDYQMTIIMVHHDINQAIHYSDEIIAMKNGQLMFQGKPHEVINQKTLKEVYDYDLNVIKKDLDDLSLSHDIIVVEGSGGIICPLKAEDELIMLSDVMKLTKYPLIIVTSATLGSINSAVLTALYAKSLKLEVLGFIMNYFDKDNSSR